MVSRGCLTVCVLFGCAACCRAQQIYTTGVAISSSALFSGGFNLEGRFEPGAPNIFGFGYTTYTVNSGLSLVFQGQSLGGVQPNWSVVSDGTVLDHNHPNPGTLLNGYQLTLNQPFLVGLDLVNVGVSSVTAERFGWARLEYTSAGMQVLDQATAGGQRHHRRHNDGSS